MDHESESNRHNSQGGRRRSDSNSSGHHRGAGGGEERRSSHHNRDDPNDTHHHHWHPHPGSVPGHFPGMPPPPMYVMGPHGLGYPPPANAFEGGNYYTGGRHTSQQQQQQQQEEGNESTHNESNHHYPPEPARVMRRPSPPPLKPPQIWRTAQDPKTGKPYYFHSQTKKVTWDKPEEMVLQERQTAHWMQVMRQREARVRRRNAPPPQVYVIDDSDNEEEGPPQNQTPAAASRPSVNMSPMMLAQQQQGGHARQHHKDAKLLNRNYETQRQQPPQNVLPMANPSSKTLHARNDFLQEHKAKLMASQMDRDSTIVVQEALRRKQRSQALATCAQEHKQAAAAPRSVARNEPPNDHKRQYFQPPKTKITNKPQQHRPPDPSDKEPAASDRTTESASRDPKRKDPLNQQESASKRAAQPTKEPPHVTPQQIEEAKQKLDVFKSRLSGWIQRNQSQLDTFCINEQKLAAQIRLNVFDSANERDVIELERVQLLAQIKQMQESKSRLEKNVVIQADRIRRAQLVLDRSTTRRQTPAAHSRPVYNDKTKEREESSSKPDQVFSSGIRKRAMMTINVLTREEFERKQSKQPEGREDSKRVEQRYDKDTKDKDSWDKEKVLEIHVDPGNVEIGTRADVDSNSKSGAFDNPNKQDGEDEAELLPSKRPRASLQGDDVAAARPEKPKRARIKRVFLKVGDCRLKKFFSVKEKIEVGGHVAGRFSVLPSFLNNNESLEVVVFETTRAVLSSLRLYPSDWGGEEADMEEFSRDVIIPTMIQVGLVGEKNSVVPAVFGSLLLVREFLVRELSQQDGVSTLIDAMMVYSLEKLGKKDTIAKFVKLMDAFDDGASDCAQLLAAA